MSTVQPGLAAAPSERRERTLVILAVVIGVMFSALDQLIVITAMPRVVADLGGLADFAWVFTGYTLVSTVSLPVWGKLSDVYGQRRLWLGGLVLFMTGSAVAGASQEMVQLILSRGVQGLGAGALMALGPALIASLFPPSERAKWQGALMALFGLVVIAGPTLGGWITDTLSWRWVFYVNLPFGGLAVIAAWFGLPAARPGVRPAIDIAGALALVGAAVPLLLAFSWAGGRYPWLSAPIVGLLLGSAAMLGVLVALERRAADPMINLAFLTNRVYVVAIAATFLASAGLIGAVLYIPLFAQAVMGASATNSGAVLVPMMLAFVVSAIAAGQIMSRTGRYKALILSLFAVGIVGRGAAGPHGCVHDRAGGHAQHGGHWAGHWRAVLGAGRGGAECLSRPQSGRSDGGVALLQADGLHHRCGSHGVAAERVVCRQRATAAPGAGARRVGPGASGRGQQPGGAVRA